MYPVILILAAASILSSGIAQAQSRSDQWILRQETWNGSPRPTAVFLSWNLASVLFRAACVPATGELVLEFQGEGVEAPAAAWKEPLAIHIDGTRIAFNTQTVGKSLVGHVRMTPAIRRRLSAVTRLDREVEIVAPDQEYGVWFVGQAEPLRRIASSCSR